ncbi:MAG: hypothetical protein ACW980_21740 [Promethearchaeota archaeon]|jgi:hypothetical protein
MAKIDRKKLKKDIHSKFGSLTNFSKITHTNYNDLLRILNSSNFSGEEIHDIQFKYLEFDTDGGIEGYINDSDRESIRICIAINYKSYTSFCDDNPNYDEVYLSNIINGKLKKITTKYGGLLDLLKNKYNYDKFTV